MPRLSTLGSRIATIDTRSAVPSISAGSGFSRTDGRTRQKRGYDAAWERLRKRRLEMEPLCRFCAEQGRVTAATHCDHIEPFHGLDDPLRLDIKNTRSLCQPCHMARTARQASGRE